MLRAPAPPLHLSRRAVLAGMAAGAVAGCAGRSAPPALLPPVDPAADLASDLVDLARYDPRLRLDIRYATSANFMGRVLYPVARAVAQRPVAEALAKVQTRAEAAGYGLLIFDAYRPWRITKAMWDQTPPDKREFVANPSAGSRHNRGCSIDLSLHKGGVEVTMPSPYDDFTPAAYRSFTDAPPEALAASRLLEIWMVAEGFVPLPNEWWHYDWAEWRRYPIMDTPLEAVTAG
ncbi:M15 family metallopeptidase [Erythrobacter oryzae]|uniref:M15 family metallopeptidase n=1 Tax=Erythrobacter oryzae TaxID=3019556 RepID=UPI002555C9B9|nr:M15 family metallopeptidase [Erythrobacter sp. COR-2]